MSTSSVYLCVYNIFRHCKRMWVAEDWSICQSWVILFGWNSIGCFNGIFLAHWWKGKENLGKLLLLSIFPNCFLVISLFVKLFRIGALAGDHMRTHCASVVTSYYNHTNQLGERGQIFALFIRYISHDSSSYSSCCMFVFVRLNKLQKEYMTRQFQLTLFHEAE